MYLAEVFSPAFHYYLNLALSHWSGISLIASILFNIRLSRRPANVELRPKDAATIPQAFWRFIAGWRDGWYDFRVSGVEARQRWEKVRPKTVEKDMARIDSALMGD